MWTVHPNKTYEYGTTKRHIVRWHDEGKLAELEEHNYTPGAYLCSMFSSKTGRRGNSVTQDILGHESIFYYY